MTKYVMLFALIGLALPVRASDTGTDPDAKFAWGANVGWVNAAPAGHEVTVRYYEGTGGWLSGHAWGENVGWVKFSGTSPDYGLRTLAF